MKYFALIAMTAVVKLIMFFVFRSAAKTNNSPVIKVMQADSLMDFFVTCVTLVSFVAVQYTEFTVDAFAGLLISVIIIISAIKLIKSNLFGVINFVPKELRNEVELAAEQMSFCKVTRIVYCVESNSETLAYVTVQLQEDTDTAKLEQQVHTFEMTCENAGVKAQVIINF